MDERKSFDLIFAWMNFSQLQKTSCSESTLFYHYHHHHVNWIVGWWLKTEETCFSSKVYKLSEKNWVEEGETMEHMPIRSHIGLKNDWWNCFSINNKTDGMWDRLPTNILHRQLCVCASFICCCFHKLWLYPVLICFFHSPHSLAKLPNVASFQTLTVVSSMCTFFMDCSSKAAHKPVILIQHLKPTFNLKFKSLETS